MKLSTVLLLFGLIAISPIKSQKVIGVHLLDYTSDEALIRLSSDLDGLKKMGINTLFLEVDYHFDFQSHPELVQTNDPITKKGAEKFAKICADKGMKIIPQFQCLGHQSWEQNTWKLLEVYPELDLTPGAFPNNDSIYCREWDVMNIRVNQIIFPMIEEILTAFNADGLHLGLDEVFLLGNAKSPSTVGKDPAFLFGKTIREFHQYFTVRKHKQLYMWGDRLIDGPKYGYGKWESSFNGTAPAIDSIPKDIIICDWHYNEQQRYPSVDLFLEKGFRVLPSSWKEVDAAKALIRYSFAQQDENMLGHLFTLWGAVTKDQLLSYPSMNAGLEIIKGEKYHEVYVEQVGVSTKGKLNVKMTTANPSIEIHYTLNGIRPTIHSTAYQGVFEYESGQVIKALPFKEGEEVGLMTEKEFLVHKGLGKKVTFVTPPSDKYGQGDPSQLLVNGEGFTLGYSDGQWLGYEGNDLELIIDLGQADSISTVSMNFHNKVNDWVHHPKTVEIYGSLDGNQFFLIDKKKLRKIGRPILSVRLGKPSYARFVKVVATNQVIPEGFNGAGEKAWIFLDEVVVQ